MLGGASAGGVPPPDNMNNLKNETCIHTAPTITHNHNDPNAYDTYVKTFKCARRSCDTCIRLRTGCQVQSLFNNYSRRSIHLCRRGTYLSCDTKNVVYLLSCNTCGVQYVGETRRKLRERMGEHLRSITKPGSANCKIMASHFSEPNCRNNDFNIQILEKIRDDLAIEEGTRIRQERESYWIKLLKSKYPYGLNQKLPGCLDEQHIHSYFTTNRPKNKRRGKRKNRKYRLKDGMTNIDPRNLDLFTSLKELYKTIHAAGSKTYKRLIAMNADDGSISISHKLNMLYDVCRSKLYRQRDKKKPYRPHILFRFEDKGLDLINIRRILQDRTVMDCWPTADDYDKVGRYAKPLTIFKYDLPISSFIFNYRKTARELSTPMDLNTLNHCGCKNSALIDTDHGHIITGDLSIVDDPLLRSILEKGPKYRIPQDISWDRNATNIRNGIREYIVGMCNKFDVPSFAFEMWIHKVGVLTNDRIEKFRSLTTPGGLQEEQVTKIKTEIRKLQRKFVITTVDKANQNFAFICKHYYRFLLLKEIGYYNNSNVYKITDLSTTNLLLKLRKDIEGFDIPLMPDAMELPFIQLVPKFHKNPVKFRPIIASRKSISKCVSKRIGFALKLLLKRHLKFCNTLEYSVPGLNLCWITDNNLKILKTINNLNLQNNFKSVHTFDFTTLYTCLEHQEITKWLERFLDSAFKNTNKSICLHEHSANWCWTNRTGTLVNKDQILILINWLISNTYFSCGDLVVKQDVGIPMGTDCAPDIANITLGSMEFKFVNTLLKTNLTDCKKLRYTYRYLDDITCLNDGGFFEKHYGSIYPDSLQLVKMNNTPSGADVLDIQISAKNGLASTTVFDKRKSFPFATTKFPHITSNISGSVNQNVFNNQINRFLTICNSYEDFILNMKELWLGMVGKGHNSRTLHKWFIRSWNKRNQWGGFPSHQPLLTAKKVLLDIHV